MIVKFNEARNRFEAIFGFDEFATAKPAVKAAGFAFDGNVNPKVWHTAGYRNNIPLAQQVLTAKKLFQYADDSAQVKMIDVLGRAIDAQDSLEAELANKQAAVAASRAAEALTEVPAPAGLSYLPYQIAGIGYAARRTNTLIGDEMGLGKEQPIDAKVLTPTGWRAMGEITPGDLVIGLSGQPIKVLAVFPQGIKSVYRVDFNDGSSTECGKEHLWRTFTALQKSRGMGGSVKTTEDISRTLFFNSKTKRKPNARHYIPIVSPVHFEAQGLLPLPPYVVGYLLGNGNSHGSTPSVSIPDDDTKNRLEGLLPVGLRHSAGIDYVIRANNKTRRTDKNPVTAALRQIGLSNCYSYEKFIPAPYKFASVADREELVRGLMDSDGGSNSDGSAFEFSSTSRQLMDDIIFVLRSLGCVTYEGKPRITKYTHNGEKREGRLSFRLIINPRRGFQLFHLTRKKATHIKYFSSRAIESVTYVGEKECKCILVDSPDHLYVTDDFIVTHNTIQAIGVSNADSSIRSILIICPASLKLNWEREFQKWDVKGLSIGIATSKNLPQTDVVIINYDIVKNHHDVLIAKSYDLLIVDEAHKVKNPKALRTKFILGKKAGRKSEAVAPIPAKRRVFLTGTPIVNRPIEMWSLVEALDPDGLGRNFFSFARRYCGAVQTRFGWDFNGATNLPELQEKLRAAFMVRRLKHDVLKELPAKRRQVIMIEPDNKGKALIEKERAAYAKIESGEESVAFSDMSRARHDLAVYKLPFAIEHITDLLDELDKVVVMCHHRDVAEGLHTAFSDSVMVHGDVKLEDRQAAVDRFQTDLTCKVFVGTIQAAGVGLTLTAASTVVFIELDWVPGNVSQAEDRCHRIGQTEMVEIQHLILSDSLDARMINTIIEKQEIIDAALDIPTQAKLIEMPKVGESEPLKPLPVTVKFKDGERTILLTPEEIEAVHAAMRILRSRCDGAFSEDGQGFSGADVQFGWSLAAAPKLSMKQAAHGQQLVRKYQKQLGEEICRAAGVKI